jgi:hypothetical protein
MSIKNTNDTIGKRTRYLPACSAVPQPTALLRAPDLVKNRAKISATSREVVSMFLLLPKLYIWHKYFYVTVAIFKLLTVTCSSTIITERIVTCALQEWLHDRATVLLYMHCLYLCLKA